MDPDTGGRFFGFAPEKNACARKKKRLKSRCFGHDCFCFPTFSHPIVSRESLFFGKGVCMAVNLYVGNLPYRIDEDSLRQLFTPFGNVETSKVIKDRQTGRSKGFGFIEMTTQAEAEAAIKGLNETALDGRNLKVNFAKPKEPRSGGYEDQ
jgi:cold-inducible RNA-binding protein